MEEIWKNSAIIAKRNVDSNQSPISIQLTELKQIIDVHSCIVLNQLPDEFYGVNIDGFSEVYDVEKVSSKNFKVDYTNGVIYFHPNNIGKIIEISYYGIGFTVLSASRIYTKYDRYGNVLETLEELIDNSKLHLKAIESLGGAVEVINKLDIGIEAGLTLHENLTSDISVATPLQASLNRDINEAETLRTEFNQDVQNGVVIRDEIRQNTIDASNVNADLENTIEVGKGSVDLIKGTGNISKIILTTDWTGSTPNLTYSWNHGLNTKNIIVSAIDENTSRSVNISYQLIDSNTITITVDTAKKLRVVLSAQYYSGGLDTKDEIINLRNYLNYMPMDGGGFDGNDSNNNISIDGGAY